MKFSALNARPCFGGDSSSSGGNTNTQTSNTDKRQVLDQGAIGFSLDQGAVASLTSNSNTSTTTNLWSTTTDAGALAAGADIAKKALAGAFSLGDTTVSGGFDLANRVVSNNSTDLNHLLSAFDSLYSKTLDSLDANVKLTGSLASTAQTAYADASNQASGNKSLVLAAIVVVGIVAAFAFGKK